VAGPTTCTGRCPPRSVKRAKSDASDARSSGLSVSWKL